VSAGIAAGEGGGSIAAMRTPAPTRWLWWTLAFVAWTALALLSVADRALWLAYHDRQIHWTSMVGASLADWYACGLFVPLLVWATRRWPIDRRHLAARVPLHAAVIVGASVAKIALMPFIVRFTEGNTVPLGEMLAATVITEIIAFGAVAALLHALEFYRRYRERETTAAQLQARLSDAQLRALRAQLNPHFLFNTLNAATALVHRDPDAADAMLTRLGELLRLTLRADPEHETPLREELAVLDRYLAIMRIRFDRVTVTVDVDARVADALVPSFILQPVVENAFEHGVARLQRPGQVQVSARASGDSLVLSVRDDGPGPEGATARGGLGLSVTRRRLAELYGDAARLDLLAAAEGGTTVEVRLPLRVSAATPAHTAA